MAMELQAIFEIRVLEFLKSCQGDQPLYGTRRTLGRLAETVPSVTRADSSQSTGSWNSSRANGLSPSPEDLSSFGDLEGGSCVFEEEEEEEEEEDERVGKRRRRGGGGGGGGGVTTRSRSRLKRRLEEGEVEGGIVTRSASKRLRFLSLADRIEEEDSLVKLEGDHEEEDEDEEEEEEEEEAIRRFSHIVTRTGRIVKPTFKF